VIAAAEALEVAFALDDKRTAMSADIRETPELCIIVRCDYERLVETALEQSEWKNVTGRPYPLRIRGELPAPRKNAILLEREICGIGVDLSGKSRGGADIPVDIHMRKWRLGHWTVEITLSRRNFQYVGSYGYPIKEGNMFFGTIAFVIAAVAAIFGYSAAKKFVRDRLRFVDGAHKPTAPIIAGIGAYLLAWVAVGLLPIVGIGTAIAFALSVALGTAAGSREVKSGNLPYLNP